MARLAEIRIVYAKEMRDALRDRRTIFALVLLPMLIYPLFVSGSSYIWRSQEKRLHDAVMTVGVEGEAGRLLAAAGNDTLVRFVRLPETAVAVGEVDAWISIPDGLGRRADSVTVRIVYNGAEERSTAARERVETLLDSMRTVLREERARTLGVDPEQAAFGPVEEMNVATAERMTGSRLGTLVPFLLILFLFSSGSYAALDAFAGERERGTLEPLLATSAERSSIVGGKFLAVLTVNLSAACLNLGSLIVTLSTSDFAASLAPGFEPRLAPSTIPLLIALSIPLAVLATSILIVVAASARTFREGQYLTFPILMTAIVPAMAGNFPGIDESWPIYVIPIANVAVVARQVLAGEVVAWKVLSALLVTSGFALIAMRRAVRVLSTESSLASGRIETPLQAESRSRVRAVFFFVAVDFLLFFHVGIFLQSQSLFAGLAAGLVGLVLIPSLLVLKILGLPIAETVRLRRVGWRPIAGAILVAPALSLAAQLAFQLLSLVIPAPEEFLKAFAELVDTSSRGPLATYGVLALTPGVCEEFLFRGVVLGILSREWGFGRAIVVSSLLFALFHLSVFRLVPVLLVGIALGLLVWRTASLVPAMVLHTAYNALNVALASESVEVLGSLPLAGAALLSGAAGVWLLAGRASSSASKPAQDPRDRHSSLDSFGDRH